MGRLHGKTVLITAAAQGIAIGWRATKAACALYLASDAANFTTGAIHIIDGGWAN